MVVRMKKAKKKRTPCTQRLPVLRCAQPSIRLQTPAASSSHRKIIPQMPSVIDSVSRMRLRAMALASLSGGSVYACCVCIPDWASGCEVDSEADCGVDCITAAAEPEPPAD